MLGFSADDMADMLDAFGEPAVTDAGSLVVVLSGGSQTVDVFTGQAVVTDPVAAAGAGDVERLGITGGEDGTEIVIGGVSYIVLAIAPDGDGFMSLRLRRTIE
jgi:hypothetical protein